MRSAPDYERAVKAYDKELTISTVADAKAMLKELSASQKGLRQLKKEITLDIKTIRAGYADKMAGAGSAASGVFTLFGQRKTAGSIRADAKRRLKSEQDRQIAPYEQVKLMIDNMINQMDRAKIQLQNYIAENS